MDSEFLRVGCCANIDGNDLCAKTPSVMLVLINRGMEGLNILSEGSRGRGCHIDVPWLALERGSTWASVSAALICIELAS